MIFRDHKGLARSPQCVWIITAMQKARARHLLLQDVTATSMRHSFALPCDRFFFFLFSANAPLVIVRDKGRFGAKGGSSL